MNLLLHHIIEIIRRFNIACFQRVSTQYENVSSFGQSKTNTIVFIPTKSTIKNKFMIQTNNQKERVTVNLTDKSTIIHIVYLDIFNKIYDYPVKIKIE